MNVCAPFGEMTILFATCIKCVSVVCVSVCVLYALCMCFVLDYAISYSME